MTIHKYLCITLMAFMACAVTSCGGDDPNAVVDNNITITPDDPTGTIGYNLPMGSFQSTGAIMLRTNKPGYTGMTYLYVTSMQNFAFAESTFRAEIIDLGQVKNLAAVRAIPADGGWAPSLAAILSNGYIVRYQVRNDATGEISWEYARLFVAGYSGSATQITGFGIKYQPNWDGKITGSAPITPDPEGTISFNLPMGPFNASNAIIIEGNDGQWTGQTYLYATKQQNFAFHETTTVAEICDIGQVNSISEINSIPTGDDGWTHSLAALLNHGYIIRLKVVNDETGREKYVYSRFYVNGYSGTGTAITGFTIKVQTRWK